MYSYEPTRTELRRFNRLAARAYNINHGLISIRYCMNTGYWLIIWDHKVHETNLTVALDKFERMIDEKI